MLFAATTFCNAYGDDENRVNNPEWQSIGYIQFGTIWEVEVFSNDNPDQSPVLVRQWLEDTETINGLEYMKLWSQPEGEEASLVSYIRIDISKNESIYAMSPQDIDAGESLIYCFRPSKDELAPVCPISINGDILDAGLTFKLLEKGFISNFDYPFVTFEVGLYKEIDGGQVYQGTTTWIRGLGTTSGFLNQCPGQFDNCTTVLRRAIFRDGTVVYENFSGIDNVNPDQPSSHQGIRYRLDGTRFRDGDKGVYIMNGKKYVAY